VQQQGSHNALEVVEHHDHEDHIEMATQEQEGVRKKTPVKVKVEFSDDESRRE